MKTDIATMPLAVRFEHLFKVISGPRFRRKQGLGNEVPFFICPFKPEEAVAMERNTAHFDQSLGTSRCTNSGRSTFTTSPSKS